MYPMNYNSNVSARYSLLDEIREAKFFAENTPASFKSVPLPPFTRAVVDGIARAKVVDPDLALIAFLASVAAADRGRHQVVTSSGFRNLLSTIIAVGVASGCGKSRAIETFREIFQEWEAGELLRIDETNKTRIFLNAIAEERTRLLRKEFAKTGAWELLPQLQEAEDAIKKLLLPPRLTVSDITSAAYSKCIAEQGYVIRLEPDGVTLPREAYSQVRKYWSGEAHAQDRVSRARSYVDDPFIVDLVFTQVKPFLEFIQDEESIERGLCARVLSFHMPQESQPLFSLRPSPVDTGIYEQLCVKLEGLLDCSIRPEEGTFKHEQLYLSPEAEDMWEKQNHRWVRECQAGMYWHRIIRWAQRMGQHALRLAGIFHLAEHDNPAAEPISMSEMQTALACVEVFGQHMLAASAGDNNEQVLACCREVMLLVLKSNVYRFSETELKQALKGKFDAAEVNVAIYRLCNSFHLNLVEQDSSRNSLLKRKGRPFGREYTNPYFEPGGFAMK